LSATSVSLHPVRLVSIADVGRRARLDASGRRWRMDDAAAPAVSQGLPFAVSAIQPRGGSDPRAAILERRADRAPGSSSTGRSSDVSAPTPRAPAVAAGFVGSTRLADLRRATHLPVIVGLSAGLYAASLTAVSVLQIDADRAAIAQRDPVAEAIDSLAQHHQRMADALTDATQRYGDAVDTYRVVAADSAETRARLDELARAVAEVEAVQVPSLPGGGSSVIRSGSTRSTTTGGSRSTTTSSSTSRSGSTVVVPPPPPAAKPTPVATTGASGAP
jgi:hypothetical protein